ncbi:MAG: phosphatase PAP2 family protein [Defluviitaleaceae bacterium]|nr:phosphatase PAP2 family protein [Defluviitaleaceae bacterium]
MELLKAIEGIRTPFLDIVFGIITRLGEQTILIVVFCVLFWCINKKMAYIMGVVFFMSSLVVQGMKIIFRVPRPWITGYPDFRPVGDALPEATGYAFPSGHTQNAAAYLGSLGATLKQLWAKVILFALPVIVAFTRMYLGVHYLSDVIASLVITFVLIFIATKVIADDAVCKKRELVIALVIVAVSIVVIVIAALRYHGVVGQASEARQLRDATRAAGAAIAFAIGYYIERMYIRFSVKTKNIWFQILKFVIGLGMTMGIQEGARVLGDSLVPDAFRYFLMVVWIMIVYPVIIKKFFSIKKEE